jgi:hypothetical protein
MAYTELDDALAITKWRNDYWQEYVRTSGYKRYMAASPNAIITATRELTDGGKDLVIPLIGSLSGGGTGSGLLTGAEERLGTFPFRTRPVWRRNAVVIKKSTVQKSNLELLNANKASLKIWSSDDMRRRMGLAFTTVAFDDTVYDEESGTQNAVYYANATATQKNNWLSDNYNRAIFGVSQANTVAGNAASSLANVDGTNDNWSAAMIDAMVDMAQYRDETLTPQRRALRPYRSESDDGEEMFVLFVGSRSFNKLKADPDIKAFNKDSRERTVASNPYFTGGDLIWNNVVIHKVPEQRFLLPGAGAGGVDVEMGFFCGAQALVVAWGQDPITTKRTDDDYQFIKGVGTEELRSIDKTFFKESNAVGPGTQWGTITGFGAV